MPGIKLQLENVSEYPGPRPRIPDDFKCELNSIIMYWAPIMCSVSDAVSREFHLWKRGMAIQIPNSVNGKELGEEPRAGLPGFYSWFYCLNTVWSWGSYQLSFGLSFLVCKKGIRSYGVGGRIQWVTIWDVCGTLPGTWDIHGAVLSPPPGAFQHTTRRLSLLDVLHLLM